MSNWIKISERKPTDADLPVMHYDKNATDGTPTWVSVDHMSGFTYTHWRHIDLPTPPKEPTQADEDDSACEKAWLDGSRPMATTGVGWFKIGWYLALRYERAEILAMIQGCTTGAIRTRCEGGRK